MNIKGRSRRGARDLADHLLNAETNERINILDVRGTVAQDLHGAFQEMEATASGTRCTKPLYHAKISPDPKEPRMTPEQWQRSIDALAEQLGLAGHPFAAIHHAKYGRAHPDILREHLHVVWGRIDPDTMRAMHDGHNYRKHEIAARNLEREFGHARIQGAHVEREGVERPERTPPDWAMQRGAKSGVDARDVRAVVKDLWHNSDTAHSFAAALHHEGLTLAIGRRDLVVVDAAGDPHTLARCLNLRVDDIRERLAEIDRSKLPTVEQVRDQIRELRDNREKAALEPMWDRDQHDMAWQDAVVKAAIEKEKIERRFVEPEPERRPAWGALAGGKRAGNEPRPFEKPLAPQLNFPSREANYGSDAYDAVAALYSEHLRDRIKEDGIRGAAEKRYRMTAFMTGQPVERDRAGLQAALEQYHQAAQKGATHDEATTAAREALHKQFADEQHKKPGGQWRMLKDPEYRREIEKQNRPQQQERNPDRER